MNRIRFTLHVAWILALVATGLLFIAPETQAISRYTATSMSCSGVRSVIRTEGAVILRWRSASTGNQRYDRFVAHSGFCSHGEIAVTASVPTADRKSCAVKECKRCEHIFDDDRFFRSRRC